MVQNDGVAKGPSGGGQSQAGPPAGAVVPAADLPSPRDRGLSPVSTAPQGPRSSGGLSPRSIPFLAAFVILSPLFLAAALAACIGVPILLGVVRSAGGGRPSLAAVYKATVLATFFYLVVVGVGLAIAAGRGASSTGPFLLWSAAAQLLAIPVFALVVRWRAPQLVRGLGGAWRVGLAGVLIAGVAGIFLGLAGWYLRSSGLLH